jgi:hypothetical protein
MCLCFMLVVGCGCGYSDVCDTEWQFLQLNMLVKLMDYLCNNNGGMSAMLGVFRHRSCVDPR